MQIYNYTYDKLGGDKKCIMIYENVKIPKSKKKKKLYYKKKICIVVEFVHISKCISPATHEYWHMSENDSLFQIALMPQQAGLMWTF